MSKNISIKDEDHQKIKNAQHILLNKYNLDVNIQNIISDYLPSYIEIADKIGKRSSKNGIFRHGYTKKEEPLNRNIYIYTAGKMPLDYENLDETWRGKLEKSFPNVNWSHPTLEGCDHSGVSPDTTVANVLELIEQSDLVIGFFDQPELYGTITEILYAASIGKDIALVFVKQDLCNDQDWEDTHKCGCCWESIGPGIQAHEYWFMERLFVDYLGVCCDRYKNLLAFYIDDIDYDNLTCAEDENSPQVVYLDTDKVVDKLITMLSEYIKGEE